MTDTLPTKDSNASDAEDENNNPDKNANPNEADDTTPIDKTLYPLPSLAGFVHAPLGIRSRVIEKVTDFGDAAVGRVMSEWAGSDEQVEALVLIGSMAQRFAGLEFVTSCHDDTNEDGGENGENQNIDNTNEGDNAKDNTNDSPNKGTKTSAGSATASSPTTEKDIRLKLLIPQSPFYEDEYPIGLEASDANDWMETLQDKVKGILSMVEDTQKERVARKQRDRISRETGGDFAGQGIGQGQNDGRIGSKNRGELVGSANASLGFGMAQRNNMDFGSPGMDIGKRGSMPDLGGMDMDLYVAGIWGSLLGRCIFKFIVFIRAGRG